jgi:hypothetical protein
LTRGEGHAAPNECVLLLGIPVTAPVYWRAVQGSRLSPFVTKLCPAWAKYRLEILQPAGRILPRLLDLGVRVIEEASLADLRAATTDASVKVVIVFSHWEQTGVELADGLMNDAAVVKAVASEFDGLVDLCVCHPESLVLSLKAERPAALVKFTGQPTRPAAWLLLYELLFEQLACTPQLYAQALEESIGMLREKEA